MLDHEKRSEIRAQAKQSKDPMRWFSPKWTFGERDNQNWKNLKATHAGGTGILDEMIAYRRGLDASSDFTDEGRERRLVEHYEQTIKPKIDALRSDILADQRAEARAAVAAAKAESLRLPEHPFEVAAAMRALDRVWHGTMAKAGPKKIRLPDLEQLEPEVQRAIAATPRIVSGLSEHDHAVIWGRALEQEGGVKIAQAREYLAAVETAESSLDYAEALAELEAGLPNHSPQMQKAKEARERIKQGSGEAN